MFGRAVQPPPRLPAIFSGKATLQASILLRLTVTNPSPKPGFPALDSDDKKFNSRLVAPTNIKLRPFGDFVKRLFLYQLNRDTAPMGRVIEEHSCAAAGIA